MTVIPAEGGALPGDATRCFARVPLPALLLLGPVAGALYVVVLPFVGVHLLVRNVVTVAKRATRHAHERAERPD